jgi:L-alanine-DL-glutamate epimerase-like enolase superfamily enzyme
MLRVLFSGDVMNIESCSHELLRYKLAKPVGGSGVSSVDVLVTRVMLHGGYSGMGFSYVLSGTGAPMLAAAHALSAKLEGAQMFHPAATWRALNDTLNRSRRGPNYLALASLDMALWDAYARARGEPLGVAMGGAPRSVPVYGSGAYFAGQSAREAADVTRAHVEAGFRGVKPRVDGSRKASAVLQAVRDAAPSHIELMCDANEKCSAVQARRLLAVAAEAEYLFVEEPLPASDLSGYRTLARSFPYMVATGEHLQGADECLPFVSEGLCSVIQPDLALIGGLTPALEASRLAAAFGINVAPHFLPGLFVHLAWACPNVSWLEDFPLLEPLFEGWPSMQDGCLTAGSAAGHGLSLTPDALARYSITKEV